MPRAEQAAGDEVLQGLQKTLLAAVLGRRPLPGMGRALVLPDLDFVLREESVVLADENLAGVLSPEGLPKPLRILSPEDIREEAASRGDVVYLRFQPVERDDDLVRLTLEARIAVGDRERAALGLSGVQVRFRPVGDEWEAVGDPAFFAA